MKRYFTFQAILLLTVFGGCGTPPATQPSPSAQTEALTPPHSKPSSGDRSFLSALSSTDDSYKRIRESFHRLKTGMTRAEVAQIIGYPRFNKDSDRWTWEFTDTGMADKETYVVEFKNGTVTRKYGVGKHYARPEEWE